MLLFNTSAQNRIPDQSNPRNTLEELFRCARTGDYSQIHLLCDPLEKGDRDTKELCTLHSAPAISKKEFRTYFKLAYSFKENQISEIAAEVPFLFGPKADLPETMRLVKRNDKWYLSSF